jgi:hypothetical protein
MMGSVAIGVLVLAIAGAVASFAVGAVYYARALAAVDDARRAPLRWLTVAVWPFATKRIATASQESASVVNKALVALFACVLLGAATISYSTNLNRFAK